jgi:peptidoglycan/LPS O-acetylase OafA/YrhL
MQFYLALPFLVLFLVKTKKPLTWLVALLLSSFLVQAFVLIKYPEIYTSTFSDFLTAKADVKVFMNQFYYPTHVRYGPLVVGMIWAWLYTSKINSTVADTRSSPQFLKVVFLAGILVSMLCAYFPVYNSNSPLNQWISDSARFWVMLLHRNLFCIGLLMALYVLHVRSYFFWGTKLLSNLLALKIWRPFSQAVFPIYLFHFPMIAIAGIIVFGTTNMKNVRLLSLQEVGLVFLLASFFSLILGSVLHIYVEKPMIEKGNKIADHFK